MDKHTHTRPHTHSAASLSVFPLHLKQDIPSKAQFSVGNY